MKGLSSLANEPKFHLVIDVELGAKFWTDQMRERVDVGDVWLGVGLM
jgi:hypothetical protein